jgi:hypothetical protein
VFTERRWAVVRADGSLARGGGDAGSSRSTTTYNTACVATDRGFHLTVTC